MEGGLEKGQLQHDEKRKLVRRVHGDKVLLARKVGHAVQKVAGAKGQITCTTLEYQLASSPVKCRSLQELVREFGRG